MKKILITMISVLCIFSTLTRNIYASTIYTEKDFKVDTIYHFKQGDTISWSDDSTFDIRIINLEYDDIANLNDVTSYTFDEDIDLIVYYYSYGFDENYVRFHQTRIVTFDMCGKGENLVRQSKLYSDVTTWAYKPDIPTYDGYLFAGWYLEPDYQTLVTWDSYGEYQIYKDTTFYAKWDKVELQCIETNAPSQSSPNQDVTIQIVPIANNERLYNVSLLQEDERPIISGKLLRDETSLPFDIEYDESNDGYFYTYKLYNSISEYVFKFWIKDNETIQTKYVLNSLDVDSSIVLDNNGYLWATNFSNNLDRNIVTLNTKLLDDYDSVSYQWQYSDNNAEYIDIKNANESSLNLDSDDLEKTWYRCKIEYTKNSNKFNCISKTINVLDSTLIDDEDILISPNSSRNIGKILQGLYIGNGKTYYCLGDNTHPQYFNVISIYNNGLKNYYISSSSDESWTIYMKDSNDNFVDSDNIENIIVNFDEINTYILNFHIVLKQSSDLAIYSDICVASNPDIYYADFAAIKTSLVSKFNLQRMELITNIDFSSANLENNAGMIIEPITPTSTFLIDTFLNGPYYNENKDHYEYIVNDYNNEQSLSYEEIFDILKNNIFDYNHGISPNYSGDNDPFIYLKKLDGDKIAIGMYCKDNVIALSWKNINSVKFKFGINNANILGINNEEIYEIIEEKPIDPKPIEPNIPFDIPKTGIN